ncbi:MAG: tetratricopeptide repeat protein [Planctomycetes bacterium]|nr:tetratricopeptide repeat protein [Planctomycetota bacterium]
MENISSDILFVKEQLGKAEAALGIGRKDNASKILNDYLIGAIYQIFEKDTSNKELVYELAKLLVKVRREIRAVQCYMTILEKESDAVTLNKLGNLYQYMGRLTDALEYQKKAVEAESHRPELWANLARVLMETGQIQNGIDLLRKAIDHMPENAHAHSNLLFRLHQLPQLDPKMLYDEHKKWAQKYAPISLAKSSHGNNPDPDRKLKVGYISPDFRMHPVAFFFEPLLDGHNRDAVEVYGYGNVAYPDTVTERFKSKFDNYRDIYQIDDKQVVNLIEEDQIDILVDLAGHTSDNRLGVMACKPAPVQVTYLGYSDTTGMEAIDYRMTDSITNPPQSQQYYSEKLVCLPGVFSCYRPLDFAPSLTPLPASQKGHVTFASFNNSCKIHLPTVELWAKILKANDNSRMIIRFKGGDDEGVKQHWANQFEQLGILQNRVDVGGWKSLADHLEIYSEVDIILDTYPFNGHTNTCEALWMGVPTISLIGQCHVSRFGLSMLSCVGLEFFAASTGDEYVKKAIVLAQNLEALSILRRTMRGRISASGLCYSKGFGRKVEAAYRKMWHQWCQSKGVDISKEHIELGV